MASNSVPIVDAISNIFNASGDGGDGEIMYRFSRQIITNDTMQDVPLNEPTVWVWVAGVGEQIGPIASNGTLNMGIPITLMTCEG